MKTSNHKTQLIIIAISILIAAAVIWPFANADSSSVSKSQRSVRFTETGLPAGTTWSVEWNGHATSSRTDSITIGGVEFGSQSFIIATPIGEGSDVQYVTTSPLVVSVPAGIGDLQVNTEYAKQYQVNFIASGLDSDASINTVLALGGVNYPWNNLPSNAWVNSGTAFTWAATVSGGSGIQFVKTAGESGAVTSSDTFSATHQKQFFVTFTATGLDSGAGSNPVLTIGTTNYAWNQLPSMWLNKDTTYSWMPTVSGGTGIQFITSALSGSITAAAGVSAFYTKHYEISFAVSPSLGGQITAPATTTPAWQVAGSTINIAATANVGYTFSSWTTSNAAITFAASPESSTTATIKGPGTITANFVQFGVTPTPTPTPTSPPTSTTTGFSGFLPPLKEDGTRKAGSTIPVKFRLTSSNGALITTAKPTLWYAKVTNGEVGAFSEAVSTSKAATGNLFRSDSGQFIFNFSTKGLSTGEYQLKVVFGDGRAPETVNIILR